MNTKNSKTSEPHRLKYNLIDKLDFKNPNKNMALASLSIGNIGNKYSKKLFNKSIDVRKKNE